MSTVLDPVIALEKQLDDAKQKAIRTLLDQRDALDQQLARLGHGRRGRKPQTTK
jgi:hypothetical protein